MNKRRFKRARQSTPSNIMEVKATAAQYARNAEQGIEAFQTLASFIFFSTVTGEAWLLDHRENLALRLADKYEPLNYKIKETRSQFEVEWTERFVIEGDAFIVQRGEKASVFYSYPLEKINTVINKMSN